MKILVTPRSFGKTDPSIFQPLFDAGLEVSVNDSGGILDREGLAKRLAGCAGVILGVDPLDAGVLARAPELGAVAKYGVGVDNIDLEECRRRGIKVSLTLGANTEAVADCAFALLLAAARRLVLIDGKCRRRDWSKTTGLDVAGKTLGLIGLGAVGKGVAARARGFGMRVLAHDPFWDNGYAAGAGVVRATPDAIYAEADFISLHVPLNRDTRGMIGRRELAVMKRTVVLVNTARGGIIDEGALLDALEAGTIYGAGIDAFTEEPPRDPRWFALDNLILGSHSAASTRGATEAMGRLAAANLLRDLGL
ncbi:MAG: phosphoglycerate dehydrogenase [Planctomycetota bacterium]|jgi:D-3-phosphoglycerate dehydrogenase|nr:phosphoglycerate dehydrogenase [Planctomycetota bacterium]